MNSASMERRVAPRFAVRCKGELASGSGMIDVVVSDMSVTGCGIEVADYEDVAPNGTGVLRLQSAESAAAPVMLPVVISNHRIDAGRARFGLQFRRLTLPQMRSLIGVIDGMVDL